MNAKVKNVNVCVPELYIYPGVYSTPPAAVTANI